MDVRFGLDVCLENPPAVLTSSRFGLLCNQASLDRRFRYAHRLWAARFPRKGSGAGLAAVFSPQHGLWGEQQANMIETADSRDAATGLPIYSLYGQFRRPTPEMLDGLDLLVVDLQDVGTRVYTFAWTLTHCLQACAENGIAVLVLDRPNPLGGLAFEGRQLQRGFESFVGLAPIPMRHGLTFGELARFLNERLQIGAELGIVPMDGWRRTMPFEATGREWVTPSPNLPRMEGVQAYPGMVLLEGTNLSEGRGTTTPFELFGAPFIDPDRIADALNAARLPGVTFRSIRFQPTFDKWAGESCRGAYLHLTDPERFEPYRTAITILARVKELWPAEFAFLPPPYEYETQKPPIDIISGGDRLRIAVENGELADANVVQGLCEVDGWGEEIAPFLMYGPSDAVK